MNENKENKYILFNDNIILTKEQAFLLNLIKKRKSIRKYKNIPVEWSKIIEILDAGRLAPNSGNIQAWKFIVITQDHIKNKVAEACLHQFWINTAPVLIVICNDTNKVEKFYGRFGKMYATLDSASAAENMIIAAESLGLSSCFISGFDADYLKEILNCSSDPYVVLTIGYADEDPPRPPKYSLYDVVYLEKYGNRIKRMDLVLQDYRFGEKIKNKFMNLFNIFKRK